MHSFCPLYHFNRPWDRGRTEAVLILLDHSFEMLLKAAIRHRQGKIRRPREKQTIGLGIIRLTCQRAANPLAFWRLSAA